MPKLSRITAVEAEKILLDAGFTLMRSKGSHRIYFKGNTRVVIPFHGSRILHPKIGAIPGVEKPGFCCEYQSYLFIATKKPGFWEFLG